MPKEMPELAPEIHLPGPDKMTLEEFIERDIEGYEYFKGELCRYLLRRENMVK